THENENDRSPGTPCVPGCLVFRERRNPRGRSARRERSRKGPGEDLGPAVSLSRLDSPCPTRLISFDCALRTSVRAARGFRHQPGGGGTTMNDGSSLQRQWVILRTLAARQHGVTVRELAAEMEVNPRTIRRDLDLFRSVGFVLEESVGPFNRKAWRIKSTGNQPPLSFTFEEAAALYLGRRLLQPLAGTLLWEAAHHALRKVKATLGQTALDYLDRFGAIFHFT